METVVKPPEEAELQLLTDWTEQGRNARIGRSAVLSLLTHAAMIIFVLVMPETFMQPPPRKPPTVTILVLPPLNLTQTAPNPHKLVREFRSSDLTPRVQSPRGPSPEPQAAAPHKTAPAPPPPPKAAPQTPLPEPPKVQIAADEPPKLTIPEPPPQAPQPKTPFEDVRGVAGGQPSAPGNSLEGLARGGVSGTGGANSQGTAPIASTGATLPALLSDPKGVDFSIYLARVRDSVDRVFKLIFPKNGHRGYVSVQFSIQRDGSVGKVVFAQQTGDRSMDDTAIQALSAAGPFGPLPGQYTEAEIHVQMNFSYNQPKR